MSPIVIYRFGFLISRLLCKIQITANGTVTSFYKINGCHEDIPFAVKIPREYSNSITLQVFRYDTLPLFDMYSNTSHCKHLIELRNDPFRILVYL